MSGKAGLISLSFFFFFYFCCCSLAEFIKPGNAIWQVHLLCQQMREKQAPGILSGSSEGNAEN